MATQSLQIPVKQPESCGTCYFCRVDANGEGRCHKGPPQFRNADVQFPPVPFGEWCGEWKSFQAATAQEKPKR